MEMEEHMQNMQFQQEPEVVCDQKQHLSRHLMTMITLMRLM
jgi:hypothetical protein